MTAPTADAPASSSQAGSQAQSLFRETPSSRSLIIQLARVLKLVNQMATLLRMLKPLM